MTELRNRKRKFSTVRDFFHDCGGRFIELHGKQGEPLRLTVEELFDHFHTRGRLETKLRELREKPIELSRERKV